MLTLRLQPSNYRSRKGKQGLKTGSPHTLLSWLLWELGLQQTAPHPARTCKASTSHTPFQAAARRAGSGAGRAAGEAGRGTDTPGSAKPRRSAGEEECRLAQAGPGKAATSLAPASSLTQPGWVCETAASAGQGSPTTPLPEIPPWPDRGQDLRLGLRSLSTQAAHDPGEMRGHCQCPLLHCAEIASCKPTNTYYAHSCTHTHTTSTHTHTRTNVSRTRGPRELATEP